MYPARDKFGIKALSLYVQILIPSFKYDIMLKPFSLAMLNQRAGANNLVVKQLQNLAARIIENLANTEMLFIAAGMGGGTGTGAPVITKSPRN